MNSNFNQIAGIALRFGVFLIVPALYVCTISAVNSSLVSTPDLTESNLVITPEKTHADWLFLGTSQSRTFSRDSNREIVDGFLSNRSWINLSQGSGGGGYPSVYSLSYFLQRGNTVDTVFYFISPWVFFSEDTNDNHPMTRREPFRFDFLKTLLASELSTPKEVRQYLARMFAFDWQKRCQWTHFGKDIHGQGHERS